MPTPSGDALGALSAPDTPDARLQRLRRYALWMDAGFRVPFTSLRFGVDPIVGLVPGLGDAAGALMASWVLLEAVRLGASRTTLMRMAGNIAADTVVGAVPVLGDIADVVWKANLRNVALLERHAADAPGTRAADRRFVIVLLGAVALLCLAVTIGGVLLGAALVRAILQ
jgi:hypothetical protein